MEKMCVHKEKKIMMERLAKYYLNIKACIPLNLNEFVSNIELFKSKPFNTNEVIIDIRQGFRIVIKYDDKIKEVLNDIECCDQYIDAAIAGYKSRISLYNTLRTIIKQWQKKN